MAGKLADREQLKNTIIEMYYNRNIENDFVDLRSDAADLEEPFIDEIKKETAEYMKHKTALANSRYSLLNQIAEVEELEDPGNDDVVDIDMLNNIEALVIRTLQYLNLELYNSDALKEFIIEMTLADFAKKELSFTMKDKIRSVISNLVEHEVEELDHKKHYRKEKLVQSCMDRFSEIIKGIVADHNNRSLGYMTFYQRKNFREYIYKVIMDNYFDEFKKQEKMNYEEVRFVDMIIKKMIINKTEHL